MVTVSQTLILTFKIANPNFKFMWEIKVIYLLHCSRKNRRKQRRV